MDAQTLASPRLYPLSFDGPGERVRLVTLEEEAYRAASFLDERLLPAVGLGQWAPIVELRQAMKAATAECDFIFHIGHVGSTLLSRLLGEDQRIFAVREPAILRTLAVAELGSGDPAQLREETGLFLKLWARVFRPEQKTLLKATSFVSEMAPLLMRLNPSASAILMFVPPEVYLCGILASESGRGDLAIYASMRLARLHRRLGGQFWRVETLSEGERAAMAWTCEVMALCRIADQYRDRILWIEFDAFLARPQPGLSAALSRLHGSASQASIDALLQTPHLRQYAKAPEYAFDTGLRQQVLARAGARHGEEIRRGLAWLEAAAGAHPMIEEALGQIAKAADAG